MNGKENHQALSQHKLTSPVLSDRPPGSSTHPQSKTSHAGSSIHLLRWGGTRSYKKSKINNQQNPGSHNKAETATNKGQNTSTPTNARHMVRALRDCAKQQKDRALQLQRHRDMKDAHCQRMRSTSYHKYIQYKKLGTTGQQISFLYLEYFQETFQVSKYFKSRFENKIYCI